MAAGGSHGGSGSGGPVGAASSDGDAVSGLSTPNIIGGAGADASQSNAALRRLSRRASNSFSLGGSTDPFRKEGFLLKLSPVKTTGWQRR